MAPRWRKQTPRAQPPPTPRPQPPGGFHITRLDPKPAAPQPAPAPQAPGEVFAARFAHPADALMFIAAVHAGDPHRTPEGQILVVVRPRRTEQIELARALGGVVYLADGTDLVSARDHRYAWADAESWPVVSCIELAASVAPGQEAPEQREVMIVTTGSLARWVLDRFQSADLDVTVCTGRLDALFRRRQERWAAVLITVTAGVQAIPRALPKALSGLPHTVICRPGGGRLLIDHRLALPLSDEELGRQVPDGQVWLLAGGLGVWQLTERGTPVRPPLRADPALQPPPVPADGRFPPDLGVNVTLVPDEQPRTIDALLLSDDELLPLRRFLSGHPSGDKAFLVLGSGWHLLAEPGRDVADIPFGLQLHRIGPGGLYQQAGWRLHPAVPGQARAELFGVDARSLVILRKGASCRLALANTVPVWSLWLGHVVAADPAAAPLSASARSILERVDSADARVTPAFTAAAPEVTSLRTEGFQLEQQGRLAEAARKYWEAGEHAVAARLYELAAGAGP